jgi:hypothetical protein
VKKFDGKHRKRIGRKKREAMAWDARRAQARFGGKVKLMRKLISYAGDPLQRSK